MSIDADSNQIRNDLFPKNVALFGCGYWGKNLARNLAQLGSLKYICDPDYIQTKEMAKLFAVDGCDIDLVLQDSSIESVFIAAPAALHAELTKRALNAGKHVFVEKPLALSLTEAKPLIKLAKDVGKTLMVGHLLQYHPAFLKAKDMVESGALGTLQYIYSTRLNFGKIRTEEDILWSFAPHDISMILGIVGEEPTYIDATGDKSSSSGTFDTTLTHLKFPNNIAGHIFVSWLHPYKEQKLVIVADKGMMVFDDTLDWDKKLAIFRHEVVDINGRPHAQKGDPEYIEIDQQEPLKNECMHFLECVQNGAVPRTNGEEGLAVLNVLTQASKSLINKEQAKSA